MVRKEVEVFFNMLQHRNSCCIVLIFCDKLNQISSHVFLLFELFAENSLFEIGDERFVFLLCSCVESFANIFQEVCVAELYGLVLVHTVECSTNALVVIANNATKTVVCVSQFHEELSESKVVLTRHKDTNRNVVCFVVNAVDEWNLSVIAFYLYKLSIH